MPQYGGRMVILKRARGGLADGGHDADRMCDRERRCRFFGTGRDRRRQEPVPELPGDGLTDGVHHPRQGQLRGGMERRGAGRRPRSVFALRPHQPGAHRTELVGGSTQRRQRDPRLLVRPAEHPTRRGRPFHTGPAAALYSAGCRRHRETGFRSETFNPAGGGRPLLRRADRRTCSPAHIPNW